MPNNLKLSVIISTYKRPEKLLRCLNSLKQAQFTHQFEILVVDDGGALIKELQKNFADLNIRWIYLEKNIGQPAAQSEGVRLAKSEIYAFLDDDAIVDLNWLKEISLYFKNHPDIGAILGKIEPLDDTHLLSRTRQQIYNKRHDLYTDQKFINFLKNKYRLKINSTVHLSNRISGGNFAIRKNSLEKIGGLPVALRLSSDTVVSDKLLLARIAIGYNQKMIIYHEHNTSYYVLYKNNFLEGRDWVKIQKSKNVTNLKLFFQIFGTFLMVPFKIKHFPQVLNADRNWLKGYFVYTSVQFFDVIGRFYQAMLLFDKS
jgi:GT2 family glycosyltransferase